uniref:Uncharacterized protein n=1 Tax=Amphora coffeiformis TaxID=265554 RepID=A0A7S3LET5_9STRA|mmetsp:Transcript_8321/g.15862  ORF Transcript_8321/g.15862 Transcript_8321/m.15862 type:complete len:427 (+) Transcript_8321:92-1372(+)|eukprot:scaffold34698_cov173-Amphora_coffeaeformis.AAC.8
MGSRNEQKRFLLPCLLSCFIAVFTLLSLWNSHKAISVVPAVTFPAYRPGSNWARDQADDFPALTRKDASRQLPRLPEPVCLTETCLVEVAQSVARSFPERPKESWCIHTETRGENSFQDDMWQGLLLVKVPKAASSTAAGLALRIGNRTQCATQWEHREGINYANRSKKSFLFGSVRRPASRNLSSVWFFMIAPLDIEPTDNNIIRSLHTHRGGKTKGKGGFQFVYLSLEPIEARSVWTPHSPSYVIDPRALYGKIQRLLESYDFMMVVERMDESLTAMALLTGLSLVDVLVTSSKVAGGYLLVRVGKDAGQCRRQLKGPMSEGVKNYTESDEWLAMNYADEILFRAANASLDRTIEQLGRERFERKLQEFRQLKERVLEMCGDRLGFGCTDQGEVLEEEQCYLRDFGCGYSCVDSVVDRDAKDDS